MRKAIFLIGCVTLMTGTAHGDISGRLSDKGSVPPEIEGITVEAYRFNESGGFFEHTGSSGKSDTNGDYTITEISAPAGNNIMVVANGNSQAGRGVVLTPWDKNGQFYNTALNYGTATYKASGETNPFSLVAWDATGVNIDLSNSKTTCSVIGSVGIAYKINKLPIPPDYYSYPKFDVIVDDGKPSPVLSNNKELIQVQYKLYNPDTNPITVSVQPVAYYLSSDAAQAIKTFLASSLTIPAKGTVPFTTKINIPIAEWNELSGTTNPGAWVLNAGIQFINQSTGLPACETLLFPVKKPKS